MSRQSKHDLDRYSYRQKFILLDQKILLAVQKWRLPFLNKLFLFLTYSGTSKAWFGFAFILNTLNFAKVHILENQSDFLRVMFCPLLAWLAGTVAKKLIPRNRPSEEIFGYTRIIESPTCGSFPSSHAAAVVAFYSALEFISHPLAPFVGVWALLVSFSRLYLGVHYLTDIIGGAILGILMAIIFIWFVFL